MYCVGRQGSFSKFTKGKEKPSQCQEPGAMVTIKCKYICLLHELDEIPQHFTEEDCTKTNACLFGDRCQTAEERKNKHLVLQGCIEYSHPQG